MFGKLRTKHLVLLLLGLAGLWWLSGLVSPRARQRTFREELLRVDSNAVTAFTIVPAPFKQLPALDFHRRENGWLMVMLKDSSLADPAPIHEFLRTWSGMRVSSLAGRVADVGVKYDLVDSVADRLIIKTGSGTHELIVGRTTDSTEPMTVVSLLGDENAYAIDGRMGTYADQTYADWLPKYLVTGDPMHWRRLVFNFPGDSGYVMERVDEQWTIDGAPTDQERTTKFLRSLARARGRSVTDPADTLSAVPQFRLVVEDTTRTEPIVVIVFVSNNKFIVRSSLNPATVMPFDGREEVPRMFRPRRAFMPY